MLGGIGPCGRPICCRTFLSDFTPVSIKMAKEQNLSLNPTKISGLCDRLMCCLKYEQDNYEQTRKRMPRVGREIVTPDGVGVINAINVLEETVRVRIAVGDSFELREYRIDDCQRMGQENAKPPRPEEDMPEEVAQQPADTEENATQSAEKAESSEAPRPAAQENAPRRQDARPPRPPRGGRPEREDRPERQQRGDRAERPPRQERGERPPRPPRKPMDRQRPQQPRNDASAENTQPPKESIQIVHEEKVVDVLEIRENDQKQDLL